MKSTDDRSVSTAKLRQLAEAKARSLETLEPEALSPEETRQALHELRVHQIELEMQNEELRRSREELVASRARYFDLYDLAPVGYCTVSEQGLILEANRTAATLLGVAPGALVGHPITRFILPEDQDIYYRHREQFTATGEPQACELRMLYHDGTQFWARVKTAAAQDSDGAPVCRTVLSDITGHHQSAEALKASEAYLQGLIYSIPDLIWMKDLHGVYLSCNSRFERLFGTEEKNIIGKTDYDFVDRELADFFRTNDQLAMERGGPSTNEEEVVFADDGHRETLETIKTPVRGSDGKLLGVLGIGRDITERKQAEEELRTKEAEYRLLFENILSAIVVHTPDTRVIFSNPMASTLLGLAEDQLQGKFARDPVWQFLKEDNTPIPLAEYPVNQVLSSGKRVENQVLGIRRADREQPTWVLYHAYPVSDASGRLSQVVVTFVDITERKQAQDALAGSETKFRRLSQEFQGLLDAIPDHLTLLDRELCILWANRAAGAKLGKAPEDLVGQHCYMLWQGQTEPCDPCPVTESFATGRPAAGTITWPDGSSWDLRAAPLTDRGGAVARVIEVARDVTEQRSTETQLHQAQKMEAVGRLAAGVAHDFNNLLMIILGQAELTASHLGPDDPLRPGLQGIVDAGSRAANLTRQLLAFARQEVVCPRSLDLNAAVADMEKMLSRLIGEDIELLWKPGNGVWPVYLDPSQVDQLLANLVVNARDAIADVGTVTVETGTAVLDETYCASHPGSTPGEYAVLTVSDTGVGMDRETQARIFEPFYTTKERGKGTGLGLATVYGIVKQAGGSVYVYSEPGQGTTLRLYLPRQQGEETAAVLQTAPPKSAWGEETVLLVEDEAAVLDLGRTALERQGYRVLPADTPEAALLVAREEPGEIALLATDVVMPGMNGRELYERLQAQRPDLKCLYLSGYTADVITQRGVLPEGVNFLQKPFTLKSLAQKVRAVLDS